MDNSFENNKPIFIQIRELIEDQIVNGQLKEEEQAPSTNQLVNFYKINHVTVTKGINQLVDEGILYKKRGIGMFVAKGARERLLERRKALFADEYIVPLIREATKLKISDNEVMELIKEIRRRENDGI